MVSLSLLPPADCHGTVTLNLDLGDEALSALANHPDVATVRARLSAWFDAAWTCATGAGFPCTLSLREGDTSQAFVAVAASVQLGLRNGSLVVNFEGNLLSRSGFPGGPPLTRVFDRLRWQGAVRDLTGAWRPLGAHVASRAEQVRLAKAHLGLIETVAARTPAQKVLGLVSAPQILREDQMLFGVRAVLLQAAASSLRDFVTPQDFAEALGCSLLQALELIDVLEAAGWLEEVQGSYYQGRAAWHDLIAAPHAVEEPQPQVALV